MSAEPILSDEGKALKVLTKALVKACGGPLAVAEVLDVAQSLVSFWGSQAEPGRFMPLHHIASLEEFCGRPVISSYLVRRHAAPEGPGALALADVALLSRESGEAQMTVLAALEDGVLCAADRAAIRKELDEVATVVAAMRDKVGQP
jgi:hypothetical protein